LQRGGAEDPQRVFDERTMAVRAKSRIDTALDQPGQGDAGEVGGNQRQNAEDKKTAMALD